MTRKTRINTCYLLINPRFSRHPRLIILLRLSGDNNLSNISIKSGFITIPALRFCLITLENKTYMV